MTILIFCKAFPYQQKQQSALDGFKAKKDLSKKNALEKEGLKLFPQKGLTVSSSILLQCIQHFSCPFVLFPLIVIVKSQPFLAVVFVFLPNARLERFPVPAVRRSPPLLVPRPGRAAVVSPGLLPLLVPKRPPRRPPPGGPPGGGAAGRALRYKKWEKSGGDDGGAAGPRDEEGGRTPDGGDRKALESSIREEDEDDSEKWLALDDHDKRKEYKRARKMLDTLKQDT
uniref:Uncharacterized protein n=1 Tax=Trieres chinensis TaxID=1514140 RepID=A0A7S2EL94_TRICV|mmetsp:Transcript_29131/g.59578  ORF Transcript_29131/g.59578 Transcript_29131/m.59578 type:complete len:227 (-) Transcript_29131:252-932(-)